MPPVSVLTTQTYLSQAILPTQIFGESQTDTVGNIAERTGYMENRESEITLIRDRPAQKHNVRDHLMKMEEQAFAIPTTPIASSTPIKAPKPATTDSSTSPMIKSILTFNTHLVCH